jgi:MFS family permease
VSPRVAVAVFYTFNGGLLGTWAAQTPAVMEQVGLSHAELGLALLALALGALGAFSLSARLCQRFGSAAATTGFGVLLAAAVLPLPLVTSPGWLFVALLVLGAGNGGLDVAQATQAIEIERRFGVHLLSRLHGLFSLAGLAAALVTVASTRAGWSFHAQFWASAVVCLIAAGLASPGLLRSTSPKREPRPGAPTPAARLLRPLLAIGTIALCASVAEGSMTDWSAVFVVTHQGGSPATGALAFGAFAVAMSAGRFTGDHLRVRFPAGSLIIGCAAVATAGLALVVVRDTPPASIIGFGLVGLGVSIISPLAYAAAAARPAVDPGRAVAVVATMGYTGFLAGPPVIGGLAQLTNLRWALLVIVGLLLVVMVLARHSGSRGPLNSPTRPLPSDPVRRRHGGSRTTCDSTASSPLHDAPRLS